MTAAESQRIAQQRLADIARRQTELAAKVAGIQRALGQRLDAASERMLGSPASADVPLVQWAKTDLLATVSQWAGDILAIGTSADGYFKQLAGSPKDYLAAQAQAVPLLLNRFGLGAAGQLQPGGFFAGFMGDTNLASSVKQLAWKSKAAGVGLQQFKRDINALVEGSPNRAGLVQRHFNTFAYDTYQQADAQTQDFYAVKLGLPAAMYLGGEIAGTREFCHERQGHVYTREEIAGWINLDFAGKTPDYNPFTDRGGYNCRHHLHYITARMAASRRTDLTLGTDGKLYKAGEKQPVTVAPAKATIPAAAQPPAAVQVAAAPVSVATSGQAIPYKTIPQAEAELQRLGVARVVRYGRATVAQANELNAVLADLQAKYDVPTFQDFEVIPGGINRLTSASNGHYARELNGQTIRLNEKNLLAPNFDRNTDFQDNWKRAAANYNETKRLHPDAFTGPSAIAKRNRTILRDANEAAKYGRWSVSSDGYSYKGTTVHEYGHAIHDALTGLDNLRTRSNPALLTLSEAGALESELQTEYARAIKSGDIYQISAYAKTNVKEFFAESFAMFELEPDRLPAAIKSFITKFLSHAKR